MKHLDLKCVEGETMGTLFEDLELTSYTRTNVDTGLVVEATRLSDAPRVIMYTSPKTWIEEYRLCHEWYMDVRYEDSAAFYKMDVPVNDTVYTERDIKGVC